MGHPPFRTPPSLSAPPGPGGVRPALSGWSSSLTPSPIPHLCCLHFSRVLGELSVCTASRSNTGYSWAVLAGLMWRGLPGGSYQILLAGTSPAPHPTPKRKAIGGGPRLHGEGSRAPGLPLLVSLSLIRKAPALLTGARSCLSASLRQMDLKNHLERKSTKAGRAECGHVPGDLVTQAPSPLRYSVFLLRT